MKNNFYMVIGQKSHDFFINYSNDKNSVHLIGDGRNARKGKQIVHGCHIILLLLSEIGYQKTLGIKSTHAKFLSPVHVDDRVIVHAYWADDSVIFYGKTIFSNVFEIEFKYLAQPNFPVGSKLHSIDTKPLRNFFHGQDLRYVAFDTERAPENNFLKLIPTSLCLFFASISAFVGMKNPGNGSIIGEIILNSHNDMKYIDLTKLNLARYVTIGNNYSLGIGSDSFLVRITGFKSGDEKRLDFKKTSLLDIENFSDVSDVCLVIGALGQVGSVFVKELLSQGYEVIGTTTNTEKVGIYEVPDAGNFKVLYTPSDDTVLDFIESILSKTNIKAVLFCNSPAISATFSEDDFSFINDYLNVYLHEVFRLTLYCRYLGISKIIIPGSEFEDQAPPGFASYGMVKKISSLVLQLIREVQGDVLVFNPKLPPVNELDSSLLQNLGFFEFLDK